MLGFIVLYCIDSEGDAGCRVMVVVVLTWCWVGSRKAIVVFGG